MKVYRFNEHSNLDLVTIRFINGEVSESEFKNYIQLEVLNESVMSYVKEKITNVLYSFLVKASEIGFSILNKFKSFFSWFIGTVSKWKEKHPTLYKVILITVIIIILLMVSASSAYAQSKGQPIPENEINVAIGWLDLIKGKTDLDVLEVNKAIAHLVDLRDGNIEIDGLGDKALQIADSALSTSNKMINDAKSDLDKGDESTAKMCLNLMQRGSEYITALYSKIDNTEVVKLGKL
jgi:hypothetical protein